MFVIKVVFNRLIHASFCTRNNNDFARYIMEHHTDTEHANKIYTKEDHERDMLRFKKETEEIEAELASRRGVTKPIIEENKKLAEVLVTVEKHVKVAEDVDEQVLRNKIKKMEEKIKDQQNELKNTKVENIGIYNSLKTIEQEKFEALISISNLLKENSRLESKIHKVEEDLSDERLDIALDKLVEQTMAELVRQSEKMQIVNPNAFNDDDE